MCGIAGYFGSEDIPEARVGACLSLMGRRGPDVAAAKRLDSGNGKKTLLLHSRLSIIDIVPRSNQPFERDGLWMAYNGELYNYVELKNEMTRLGVSFATQSDTEVFIAGLAANGTSFFEKADGMWALAVFDAAANAMTLSRDRFGEKPLYIVRDGSGVFFGSEVKFIFALMGRRLSVNHDQLRRYLVNGYKSIFKGKEKFFHQLEEVEPGTAITIDKHGEITKSRYWHPVFAQDEAMERKEAVDECRALMLDAVGIRLRSHVPIAFCLSGGVDSNALIATAKRIHGYDCHGFTIVDDDDRYDESKIVRAVVKELGIRHTEIPVQTDKFFERLREQVAYHDSPVATITYYLHGRLMESIAQHGYRVSVSGTGADEVFSGYYDHFLMYLLAVKDGPDHASALEAWRQHILPVVRNPHLQNSDLFIQNPEFRDHIYFDAQAFSDFLVDDGWFEPFSESNYADCLLRNRMMNEMFHESVPVILHEDDLNAMYHSIENRSPFLNHRLFDFVGRVPTRHLMRDAFNKSLLRDAMAGIVPDIVLNTRRKIGFNASILSLVDTEDAKVRDEILGDSPIFDLVHKDRIAQLLGQSQLPNSLSKFLFYFINAKLFLEEFN